MSTHMIADPSAAVTEPTTDPAWLALSAALTDQVPDIADRDDLVVTVAPGAGHGAPACFLPAHAHIELDGTHLGTVPPATITPHVIGDRARYAPAWGLLTHECAHAQHSRWDAPPVAHPGHVQAAMLLEEPRIEAAQIRRRPDDRHWLRASATELILADTPADLQMTRLDAARAAALLLARTDGGILTPTETAAVAQQIENVLGGELLEQLRALWREAFTVADTDAATMLDLGRRWYELVGPAADEPQPAEPGAPSSTGTPAPSPLADAIHAALGDVAKAVAGEPLPIDPAAAVAEARAAEVTAQKAAKRAAAKVFGPRTGGSRAGGSTIRGTRLPTDTERAAARTLARALSTAGVRDRVVTKTTSVMPPGRVRMRGAMAAEAQRAAGAIPTAEPFVRTTRAAVPTPPLRLGIACDYSGSMGDYADPAASTAWILAHAAKHATVPARTATVIFGNKVHPITYPGVAPAAVTEWRANDNWEDIPTAIDAIDAALGLSHVGAARLLVVISDGDFRAQPRCEGQRRVDRLRASGCGVLWLTPGSIWDNPLDGTIVHTLTDPTATAHAIGRAATAALRAA